MFMKDKKIFSVAYLGKDERGEIIKSIEVLAESSEKALEQVMEVSKSRTIYSAIEV